MVARRKSGTTPGSRPGWNRRCRGCRGGSACRSPAGLFVKWIVPSGPSVVLPKNVGRARRRLGRRRAAIDGKVQNDRAMPTERASAGTRRELLGRAGPRERGVTGPDQWLPSSWAFLQVPGLCPRNPETPTDHAACRRSPLVTRHGSVSCVTLLWRVRPTFGATCGACSASRALPLKEAQARIEAAPDDAAQSAKALCDAADIVVSASPRLAGSVRAHGALHARARRTATRPRRRCIAPRRSSASRGGRGPSNRSCGATSARAAGTARLAAPGARPPCGSPSPRCPSTTPPGPAPSQERALISSRDRCSPRLAERRDEDHSAAEARAGTGGPPGPRVFTSPEHRRQRVPMVEGEPVHQRRHRDVDEEALVDALGLHRERAEGDACDDRSVRFEERLAVVDHAVGHDHREDGARPEAPPERAEPEPAEEHLEREELREVHRLPGEEVVPGARASLVERVVRAEVRARATREHRRKDHGQKERVDPRVLEEAARAQAHVEQRVFRKQSPPHGERRPRMPETRG